MLCKANNKNNTIKLKHSVNTHKKSKNIQPLSHFIIIWEKSTITWKWCTWACLNGKRDQDQVVICQAKMAQITATMMPCTAHVKLCCLLQRCCWKPHLRCSENYGNLTPTSPPNIQNNPQRNWPNVDLVILAQIPFRSSSCWLSWDPFLTPHICPKYSIKLAE